MDSDTQNANQENSEHTNSDTHDTNKVVDVEKLRQEFVENYKAKNISQATHPIMRKFNSPSCDTAENVENAKVASVSCMHHCITNVCGGNKKNRYRMLENPILGIFSGEICDSKSEVPRLSVSTAW